MDRPVLRLAQAKEIGNMIPLREVCGLIIIKIEELSLRGWRRAFKICQSYMNIRRVSKGTDNEVKTVSARKVTLNRLGAF
jgi:hypothetical protein